MESIVVFILICYGITAILTQSYLFEWYRNLFKNEWAKYLTRCTQCTGFWCGMCVSFVFSIHCVNELNVLISVFLHGVISSGICYIIQSLLDGISNISKKEEETIKFNIEGEENEND
jgi:ABC-type multidrug transport system permease subunit